MKILKIIFVFAAMVVGIFVLTQWKNIFEKEEETEITEYVNINELCRKIREAWDKVTDWDEDLFKRQRSDIEQKRTLKRYNPANELTDFDTARNTLRESATNKINDAIFREFHSADCNDALVQKNYAGVDTLVTHFAMADDSRITKIKQTKKIYDEIKRFAASSHKINAEYNSSSNSWTSFETLSRSVINTAQNYRNHPIYKEHLSSITRFIDGLNDSHLRSVVNAQEAGFYKSLSNQIVTYYNDASLTEANLARFNNCYDKYSRETSRYASDIASALRSFRKRYEAEMNESNN